MQLKDTVGKHFRGVCEKQSVGEIKAASRSFMRRVCRAASGPYGWGVFASVGALACGYFMDGAYGLAALSGASVLGAVSFAQYIWEKEQAKIFAGFSLFLLVAPFALLPFFEAPIGKLQQEAKKLAVAEILSGETYKRVSLEGRDLFSGGEAHVSAEASFACWARTESGAPMKIVKVDGALEGHSTEMKPDGNLRWRPVAPQETSRVLALYPACKLP